MGSLCHNLLLNHKLVVVNKKYDRISLEFKTAAHLLSLASYEIVL